MTDLHQSQSPADASEPEENANQNITPPDETENFSPAVQDMLQKANAQAAKYRVERNQAQEALQTLQGEVESLNTQLADNQVAIDAAREQEWRLNAIASVGLPVDLASRLQGESAEELLEDAQNLARLMPVRKQSRTGHAANHATPTRAQQIFARIEGRQDDLFSLLMQERLNGGAFEE